MDSLVLAADHLTNNEEEKSVEGLGYAEQQIIDENNNCDFDDEDIFDVEELLGLAKEIDKSDPKF